jgi:hypothetical protein
MANFLSTSDLNAESLKTNFITYLQSQDKFKDYDFTGSNMSVLIDILMQNTMYNNHYLNMMGAESYLDSAQLRESIVSRAKELNYVPRSRTASRAVITVEIFPEDSPNSILIPKGYVFKSTINNETYYFHTRQNYTITKSNDRYVLSNIEIFEGYAVQEFFSVVSEIGTDGYTTYSSSHVINSENCDTNSLDVYVTLNGVRTKFERATSLYGLTSESNVYFLQGYKDNFYEVVFGDGVFGKAIATGTEVDITYTDTLGPGANGISVFSKTTSISGYSSVSITTTTTSYGGGDAETNENIKFNSVRHFQTQERAVIENDYRNLVITNFPEIQAVNVYGGENDNQYGKVIVCVKPFNTTKISDSLKNRITQFLESKNLVTEPVIKELEYFYIKVDAAVRYIRNNTTSTEGELKSTVISKLLELNDNRFNKFNQSVYSSFLSRTIDESDLAITSNSLFLKIIKKLFPVPNVETTYILEFDNALPDFGSADKAGQTFPSNHPAMIESSKFTYTMNGTDYEAWVQDNGAGILGVYTYDSEGIKVRLKVVGTVDYSIGKCVMTLAIKGYTGNVSVYAKPRSRDIIISKNKFIILDSADFNITMVADAE